MWVALARLRARSPCASSRASARRSAPFWAVALARAYAKGRRHVEATDEYATLLAVAGDAEAGVLRAEMEPILKVLGKLDDDEAP